MNSKATIIKNEKCWMEHAAITQLENVSNLSGVVRAVGLPDLHAGKSPIGIAVETQGRFYPHLIGNDIGCGMGLYETNCTLRKFKQERFVTRLNHIRALEVLPTANPYPEESSIYDLGTIGGGNHFAEFQISLRFHSYLTIFPTDLSRLPVWVWDIRQPLSKPKKS